MILGKDLKGRIGLFFGSFNPIHIGHLIIANHILENNNLDEIWFVVSPQNPLKDERILIEDKERLRLVEIAIKDNKKFKASDIEFRLERPSFTYNTLIHLKNEHSLIEFVVIIGEDNLASFDKWKNYNKILDSYKVMVYPRMGYSSNKFESHPNIIRINSPILDISSTYIREEIRKNNSIKYLVPEEVRKEIVKKELFCNK